MILSAIGGKTGLVCTGKSLVISALTFPSVEEGFDGLFPMHWLGIYSDGILSMSVGPYVMSPMLIQSCLISTSWPSDRALKAMRRYRSFRLLTSVGSSALMKTSLNRGFTCSLYFKRRKLSRRKGLAKVTRTGDGFVP